MLDAHRYDFVLLQIFVLHCASYASLGSLALGAFTFAKHNNHLGRDRDLRSTESYVLFVLKWNTPALREGGS